MLEINLLPWRSYLRERKKRIIKKIFVCSVMSIFFLAFFLSHLLVINHSSNKLNYSKPNFKLVGYIYQKDRFWGLLMLPDGQVIAVQAGTVINNENARVISVSENKIILAITNQKEFICLKNSY